MTTGIRETRRLAVVNSARQPGMQACTRSLPVRAPWTCRILEQTDSSGGGCNMSIEAKEEFRPKIVAFCCNWCSYAGADLAEAAVWLSCGRKDYPCSPVPAA